MKVLRNALLIFTVSAMLLTAVSCSEKPVLNIEFETLKSNTEITESLEFFAITDEEKDTVSKTLTELFRIYSNYSEKEFTEHLGFSKEEAEQAVVYYREYFREKGLYENRAHLP